MSRKPSEQRRAQAKERERDAKWWAAKRDSESNAQSRATYQRAVDRAQKDADRLRGK